MKKADLILKLTNINTAFISDNYLEDIEFDVFGKILLDNEFIQFKNIIRKPLIEKELIIERQKIFQDFIKYPYLIESLLNLCEDIESHKLPKYDMIYGSIPPKQKLNSYLLLLKKNFEVYDRFYNLIREIEFSSQTLNDLIKQFSNISKVREISNLFDSLVSYINKDSISLFIEYGNAYKLQKASVYSAGPNLIYSKKKLFGKKDYYNGKEYGYDFISKLQVDDYIYLATLNITSFIHQLNNHIQNFSGDLSNQLVFYRSAIKIINFYKDLGVNLVYPDFNNETSIKCSNIQDATLLFKRAKNDVVGNDYYGTSDHMYLISGVNQGGKTTFIKSLGLSLIFAQSGLPICAKEANLPIINSFISHFPKGEDNRLNSGKLEEELLRFKTNLKKINEKSLILMNESFATTSDVEGADIAYDLLRAMSIKKPFVFFVTHNYYLLKNINEYANNFHNSIKIKSLITVKDEKVEGRTYKIIEGTPQEEIETIEFLKSRFISN